LREVGERAGATRALLVQKVAELDWSALEGVRTVGITAGASAPESLVQEVLTELARRYTLQVEERQVTQEDVIFKLPYPLG
jgi:4-hydroxy-3-methylbut-2-enyl diphosphate reductase